MHRTGKYEGPVTGWHGDEIGKRPLRPSGMRQEGDTRDEMQQGPEHKGLTISSVQAGG